MHKLIVLSDLHVCAPGETIIGLDPIARLRAVLDAALSAHGDADALILLGDMTHHGRPDEYRALHDVLADVTIPVVPMLGNHDRREPFLATFGDTWCDASGFVQTVRDIGAQRIITLDSLDGPPYPPGHHAGKLCASRMAFLTAALETAGTLQPLVFVHHPPFDTAIAGMDAIKLADGEAFLDLLAGHGGVQLFCGHVHRTMSGVSRGVPWAMFKSPCHQGVLDFVDLNSSLSSNEPGAYGLLLLTEAGVVVHTEDVGIPGRRIFGGYHTHD